MSQIKLEPYLACNGNAREMMEFYHHILGGNLSLQTFGEGPMDVPASHKDKILHARLEAGDLALMAADTPPGMEAPQAGTNVSLSLQGTDEDKLRKIFDSLASGGKVTMPMEKQFWGDIFGMVDDKFGTHWMVNINHEA